MHEPIYIDCVVYKIEQLQKKFQGPNTMSSWRRRQQYPSHARKTLTCYRINHGDFLPPLASYVRISYPAPGQAFTAQMKHTQARVQAITAQMKHTHAFAEKKICIMELHMAVCVKS